MLRVGQDMQRILDRSEQLFREMMQLNPDSVPVLRMYAEFRAEMKNQPQQAIE